MVHTIYPVGDPNVQTIIDAVESTDGNMVYYHNYITYSDYPKIIKDLVMKYYDITDEDMIGDIHNSKVAYMHDVDKDLQFDLLNDPRIYAEDQIIKFLNKENVMDLESYENVKSLFESTDSGNHMLAMEIMANCDYVKSAPYLLFLVNDFRNQMYNSPSRGHVNFKSFLKYFDIRLSSSFNLSDIIFTLKKCKLATIENMEMVMRFGREDLVPPQLEGHFVVNEIVPNQQSKEAIKESIIENALDENIPYVEEEIKSKVETIKFIIN